MTTQTYLPKPDNAVASLMSEIVPQCLLPLLQCPLCSPAALLNDPTTLGCGHTICTSHVTLSSPPLSSPSSSSQTGPPTCPLPTCKLVPSTFDIRVDIHPESTVAYFPPPRTPLRSNVPTSVKAEGVKLDVTISKVLNLVQRSISAQNYVEPVFDHCSEERCLMADVLEHTIDDTQEITKSMSKGATKPCEGCRMDSLTRLNSEHRSGTHQPSNPKFQQELLTELTCEICFMLLYKPVTTPCQHTFCVRCLQRSLDHNNCCPICRMPLPGVTFFQGHPFNKIILALILKAFPDIYSERTVEMEQEERNARMDIPIFVCQLSFPGTPTILHIFEPRYRLMLRRCLQSAVPKFGMIMPPRTNGEGTEFGTILEIRTVQMFPDGRSMVETLGIGRFRLLETGSLDGYMVGRIELIEDLPQGVDDESNTSSASLSIEHNALPLITTGSLDQDVPATNEELMNVCRTFLEKLRTCSAPWVIQRLNHAYGPEPENPSYFSFWMALVLPIDEHEKAKLLPIRSPRSRLRLVVYWIEQLNNTWWYSNECMIQ